MAAHEPIGAAALRQMFEDGRSLHTFADTPVSDDTIRALYDLVKLGPTAFNSQPGRYLFVRSRAAKERLAPHMIASNRAKTLKAPVTVIVAMDSRYYDNLDRTFPSFAAREIYVNDPELSDLTALRNSSLQGGYLILAARALGLTAGPMSGFDRQGIDREFFPDGRWRSNFMVNLGYRDTTIAPRARGYRLAFDEASRVV